MTASINSHTPYSLRQDLGQVVGGLSNNAGSRSDQHCPTPPLWLAQQIMVLTAMVASRQPSQVTG